MKIHPTAVVDPASTIGDGVEIGPYCIVGPDVVIRENTRLQGHAVLEGSVEIGERNLIGYGTVIGAAPQDLSYESSRKTGVDIGNDNVIREYCSIHRGTAEGTSTRLGNNNYLMVGAHLGHNSAVGDKVIIANNCLLGGYVTVADGAFLGGGCVFHQLIRVGRLAIAQGASAFSKDIPPFVIAAERNLVFGLNAVGLRRAGVSAGDREQIKTAFRLVYSSGLNISQALEEGAKMDLNPLAREFLDFVAAAKKRGICPYKGGGEDDNI
ncbi:MAG: acyl-ACP--UDP-N-acetylglucosamine O-acyltransferase [Chthoniobacterales bacterium]